MEAKEAYAEKQQQINASFDYLIKEMEGMRSHALNNQMDVKVDRFIKQNKDGVKVVLFLEAIENED